MSRAHFIKRVRIRNYKSIAACDVELGSLNLLVGRNASGKSNFLDALRFVSDGLQYSLDHAVRSRGGIDEVRRRSTGHPHNFSIGLSLWLSTRHFAEYDFEIAAKLKGGYTVKSENLRVLDATGTTVANYRAADSKVEMFVANPPYSPGERLVLEGDRGQHAQTVIPNPPPAAEDRLYLVNAAGLPVFREAYDALSAMGFYAFNPEQIREVQAPDSADLLRRDGANLASIIARLGDEAPVLKERIGDYLSRIVSDIESFDRVALGPRETIQFKQKVKGAKDAWRFYAASMSDGTLRTLAILVAVLQHSQRGYPIRFVGVEEPETALHPAAAGALMDAMREAAAKTQIVLTTHSPELLDCFRPEFDSLLVAQANEGTSIIAPADAASREAIKSHLFTAGELLRQGQLQPDPHHHERQQSMPFAGEPA